MMNKSEVNNIMSMKIDDNFNLLNDSVVALNKMSSATYSATENSVSCWGYWRDYYYPDVIRQSYPVYIQERAQDKGKQAFEIIKMLKDKRFLKLEAVGDFIDVMDELIKIL